MGPAVASVPGAGGGVGHSHGPVDQWRWMSGPGTA